MCIRDSQDHRALLDASPDITAIIVATPTHLHRAIVEDAIACLLYTSDAADERSSVDLGGRRIIKKKNTVVDRHTTSYYTQHST